MRIVALSFVVGLVLAMGLMAGGHRLGARVQSPGSALLKGGV